MIKLPRIFLKFKENIIFSNQTQEIIRAESSSSSIKKPKEPNINIPNEPSGGLVTVQTSCDEFLVQINSDGSCTTTPDI